MGYGRRYRKRSGEGAATTSCRRRRRRAAKAAVLVALAGFLGGDAHAESGRARRARRDDGERPRRRW
jgi:hypothetical protein